MSRAQVSSSTVQRQSSAPQASTTASSTTSSTQLPVTRQNSSCFRRQASLPFPSTTDTDLENGGNQYPDAASTGVAYITDDGALEYGWPVDGNMDYGVTGFSGFTELHREGFEADASSSFVPSLSRPQQLAFIRPSENTGVMVQQELGGKRGDDGHAADGRGIDGQQKTQSDEQGAVQTL